MIIESKKTWEEFSNKDKDIILKGINGWRRFFSLLFFPYGYIFCRKYISCVIILSITLFCIIGGGVRNEGRLSWIGCIIYLTSGLRACLLLGVFTYENNKKLSNIYIGMNKLSSYFTKHKNEIRKWNELSLIEQEYLSKEMGRYKFWFFFSPSLGFIWSRRRGAFWTTIGISLLFSFIVSAGSHHASEGATIIFFFIERIILYIGFTKRAYNSDYLYFNSLLMLGGYLNIDEDINKEEQSETTTNSKRHTIRNKKAEEYSVESENNESIKTSSNEYFVRIKDDNGNEISIDELKPSQIKKIQKQLKSLYDKLTKEYNSDISIREKKQILQQLKGIEDTQKALEKLDEEFKNLPTV